ncbi:YjgN family protein [Cupriavidus pauculus]|uniref:YjgN family protein n=1 Tax=Cupriavidus pauculus TaxID=82633 RepID=UPI0038576F97
MDWEDRFTLSADFGGQADAPPRHLKFSFLGSGSEYFRIWIVNTLLTIVTFGIYSAWAKVRTLQYFYRNTSLDGASFDYHGSAKAILKGRAIIFVLILGYQAAMAASPAFGALIALVAAAAFPLLLVRSLRFRMANSSYRGLRFAFTGKDSEGYLVFLLWPILTVLSLYLLAPFAHQRFKQYQHRNTRFGTAPFAFDATAGAFYGVYLRTVGMVLALLIGGGIVGSTLGLFAGSSTGAAALGIALMVFGMYAGLMLIGPYFQAKMQNLVWNHTTLAPHRFASDVRAGRLFVIVLTNLILTMLTLGLFYPFARVRSVRYRVESMTMIAVGQLDDFVAGEQQHVSALGDAAVDWYDIDIAL